MWGHSLKAARAVDNDTYELDFDVGAASKTVQAKVLVGADGTFSRIRPLLHDIVPDYSGLTMFDMTIPAESMVPELQRIVGPGATLILGTASSTPTTTKTTDIQHPAQGGVLPQMNSGGKCRVYAALKVEQDWLDKNPLPDTGKREFIASFFPGWDQANRLILASDADEVIPRRIYQSDPDLKWDTDLTGVTVVGEHRERHSERFHVSTTAIVVRGRCGRLIHWHPHSVAVSATSEIVTDITGDAAHVMSPFAGEGVNQG
jgi:2-polyprenyl-6-methoxyphenol hydroxylase-like FAD-dependent oxidoreductase